MTVDWQEYASEQAVAEAGAILDLPVTFPYFRAPVLVSRIKSADNAQATGETVFTIWKIIICLGILLKHRS